MRTRHNILAVALLGALLGVACAAPDEPQPVVQQPSGVASVSPEDLMQLDRDFLAATQAEGIDGWLSFFAEDGQLVTGQWPGVVGAEQNRRAMGALFAGDDNSLVWEPEFGHVGPSGDMGYTLGTYEQTLVLDGRTVTNRGVYITIWEKQPDGSWKVALDGGVRDESAG